MWDRPHQLVLDELSDAQLLDWSRACIDGVSVRSKGGELTGPNPTDRGKARSKYHILCDANELPLHALLSAANTHDSTLFKPLLDKNPAVHARRSRPGRPRRRPGKLHADKGRSGHAGRRITVHRLNAQAAEGGIEAPLDPDFAADGIRRMTTAATATLTTATWPSVAQSTSTGCCLC